MISYAASPQSIGKVLDNMFRLYGATFWKVIWISVVAAIFSNLPNLFMPVTPPEDPDAAIAAVQQVLWMLPLVMVVSIYCYAAMLHRMHQFAIGVDTGLGSAFNVSLRKLLPLIAATIIYFLVLILGLVALIIPGLLFGLSLYFYMPLIVNDNLGIFSSLKSSHRLVWGNWWRTAAVFGVLMFIFIALYGIVALAGGVWLGYMSATGGEAEVKGLMETYTLVSNGIMVLFSAVFMPLFLALLLVQLQDLKLRRTGSDLEARLAV